MTVSKLTVTIILICFHNMQSAENLGRQYQRSAISQQCDNDLPVPDKAKIDFYFNLIFLLLYFHCVTHVISLY